MKGAARRREQARSAVPDPATLAALDPAAALRLLRTGAAGLAPAEAGARLTLYGPNLVASAKRQPVLFAFLAQFARPLPLLLLALAGLDLATGQGFGAAMIVAMVSVSGALGFVQEYRADRAAQALRTLVRTTVRVRRPGPQAGAEAMEVEHPLEELVPGDIVLLAAGDPVPAEVCFIEAIDLFVDQSSLTGESLPVRKQAGALAPGGRAALDLDNIGAMGTHVTSGSACALVFATGAGTGFGRLAGAMGGQRERSDFDRGIASVIALLLRIMLVMAALVLLLNWARKGDFYEALLFAGAVAVGLAPEMLPVIVTANLARGALALSRREVIVKRLAAVQTLGAIDVLCADKTGTLTQDRVVLERHVDIFGRDSERVLDYAYLNSYYQTGLRNLLDTAVLSHVHAHARMRPDLGWRKLGEIPFDFVRRRMSVVLQAPDGKRVVVCKGAVEEITSACRYAEGPDGPVAFDAGHAGALGALAQGLNEQGLRVIAIAWRTLRDDEHALADTALERELVLLGYIAFFDPPKESAAGAIAALGAHGVAVKVLSGDNAAVCAHVCRMVGIDPGTVIDGASVEAMNDAELGRQAVQATVFAKLAPAQKTRVIRCLQGQGRVVGFLGDGVNDGPALKAADVGIAVDTGAEVARESADLILLQKSLVAIDEGVLAGRRVFANIVKYIRMSASSNFGNVLSVLGASVLLPFLPMAPVQVLLNNLLYDCAQTALVTDRVDPDYLACPRRWDIGALRRYVLCFGPISSLFDYATFALLWFGLGAAGAPALFQTGWFVESLLSQTLIVYVIRTGAGHGRANWPSAPLAVASALACGTGLWLPWSPLAPLLGLVPLPAGYWAGLGAVLAGYILLTMVAKSWLLRRAGLG
ncbi:magnesium-translocating P-type ATPase [Massilia yuzhufengensis]|uniref:Magnesium-transporting ATPase, P-type 1 n=1 Tax=Massilia yuzhufengensis TaxID=1164594 RepID=A0A1I1MXS6_9BURK|nr:magnesium-translocating P-type ATPase [Massilia yuzhufengensis]SFC90254.1 Mg2+-importing ATPase [Massilia yuzhufengensis]